MWALIWSFVKPYLGYILFALALLGIFQLLNENLELSNKYKKAENSIVSLLNDKDSLTTRVVELDKINADQIEDLQVAAARLDVAENKILSLHQIIAKSSLKLDLPIIRDTVTVSIYNEDSLIIKDTISVKLSIPIDTGCIKGFITLNEGAEFAYVEIENMYDLEIVSFLKRKPKWFWRFQWGKNGYVLYVNVYNRCDPNMEIIKNLLINLK